MELLRTKAVPKLGSAVILGTTNGYLLVGCQADGVGDITCPSTAVAVYAGLGGSNPSIMGITASANGKYFYVNNLIGNDNNVGLGQCDRSRTPMVCEWKADVASIYCGNPPVSVHALLDNVIFVLAEHMYGHDGSTNGALGYCGLNIDGTINAGSCITTRNPISQVNLRGVWVYKNDWYIGSGSGIFYRCSPALYNNINNTWSDKFPKSCTDISVNNYYSTVLRMISYDFSGIKKLYVVSGNSGLYVHNIQTDGSLSAPLQNLTSAGSVYTLALGSNALYVADYKGPFYRCSLDPVTGLVVGTCKNQGSFTVGGTAYTPSSILFY
jgi:hypothetical protein